MITDEMIKSEFIHRVLSDAAGDIADTQASRILQGQHSMDARRSMASHLSGHPFSIKAGSGLSATMHFSLHLQLRFIDMELARKVRNGASKSILLYNSVVFGTLYRKTLSELKYGLTDELRSSIANELQQPV